jgi:hypothetical protein
MNNCFSAIRAIVLLSVLQSAVAAGEFWSGPHVTNAVDGMTCGVAPSTSTIACALEKNEFAKAAELYFGLTSSLYKSDGVLTRSLYDKDIAKWIVFIDTANNVKQNVIFDNQTFSEENHFLPGEKFITAIVFWQQPPGASTAPVQLDLRQETLDESLGFAESAMRSIGATFAKLSLSFPQGGGTGAVGDSSFTVTPLAIGSRFYQGIVQIPLKESTLNRLILAPGSKQPYEGPGLRRSTETALVSVATNFFNGERSHLTLSLTAGVAINAPKTRSDTYTRYRTNLYITGEWYLNRARKPLAAVHTKNDCNPFSWSVIGGVSPQLDEFIVGIPIVPKTFFGIPKTPILPFHFIAGVRYAYVNVNPTSSEGPRKRWRPSPFVGASLPLF